MFDNIQVVDNPDFASYNWEQDKTYLKITEAAHKVLSACKNSRIICLGNTPFPIVLAAECIADKNSLEIDFGYVPFSGRLLKRTKIKYDESDEPTEVYFKVKTDKIPNERIYRDYLKSKTISPDFIINLHQNSGTKTSLVDFVYIGNGYCSFITILARWALEEGKLEPFMDAINIIGINSDLDELKTLHINLGSKKIKIEPAFITVDYFLLTFLAGTDRDDETLRWAPKYTSTAWADKFPQLDENEMLRKAGERIALSI